MMITTILLDYDSTLHDFDGVMEKSLDGILGFKGEELYHIWVYDIHRALIHSRYLDHHDDNMFHCKLLFNKLEMPFDEEASKLICEKFEEAKQRAKVEPIYYPDTVEALDKLKAAGLKLCLSTGYDAAEKAATLEKHTGKTYFDYVFSEKDLGFLKTEPEYYLEALKVMRCKPSEVVSVGDTPLSDIRPAKLVGIKTIWVNRVMEERPKIKDQIADYETKSLLNAVNIIIQFNS
jgi:HAD superfamily hydrolase (TIGR01549 family)